MSYAKMMKWNKKHPKGTNQTVIMHTNNGFTPSVAFLDRYFEYVAEQKDKGLSPLLCESYYKTTMI